MDLAQQALTEGRFLAVAELNGATRDAFVRLLSPAVENAPWICERVAEERPFEGPAAVLQAIGQVIRARRATTRSGSCAAIPNSPDARRRRGR